MDIESYRICMNRPSPLMGFAIVYSVPDSALLDMSEKDLEVAIRQEHPNISEIRAHRDGCWTYIGITERSDDA